MLPLLLLVLLVLLPESVQLGGLEQAVLERRRENGEATGCSPSPLQFAATFRLLG